MRLGYLKPLNGYLKPLNTAIIQLNVKEAPLIHSKVALHTKLSNYCHSRVPLPLGAGTLAARMSAELRKQDLTYFLPHHYHFKCLCRVVAEMHFLFLKWGKHLVGKLTTC